MKKIILKTAAILITICFIAVNAPAGGPGKASSVPEDGGMAVIAAGEFMMGSPDDVGDVYQHPRHKVYLDAFKIDKNLVTTGQYRKYSKASGAKMPPQIFSGENNPVVKVTWAEAKAYCEWAGKRLPTEAEWEKAARGGTVTQWSFGDDEKMLNEYSWNPRNANHATHPVGQKKPNQYGLYDLYGNATQWVSDWFNGDYYKNSPERNPQGPPPDKWHVTRGGSWHTANPHETFSAYRGALDTDSAATGFRCAVSAGAPAQPPAAITAAPAAPVSPQAAAPAQQAVPAGTAAAPQAAEVRALPAMDHRFALDRARSYDYNGDGVVSNRELDRTPAAKKLLDRNFDTQLSVYELAEGFEKGLVKVKDGKLATAEEAAARWLRYSSPRAAGVVLTSTAVPGGQEKFDGPFYEAYLNSCQGRTRAQVEAQDLPRWESFFEDASCVFSFNGIKKYYSADCGNLADTDPYFLTGAECQAEQKARRVAATLQLDPVAAAQPYWFETNSFCERRPAEYIRTSRFPALVRDDPFTGTEKKIACATKTWKSKKDPDAYTMSIDCGNIQLKTFSTTRVACEEEYSAEQAAGTPFDDMADY